MIKNESKPNRERPLILAASKSSRLLNKVDDAFSPHGYEVIGVKTGQDLLELCKTHKPRGILIDFFLPDMDGSSACKQVREFSNVPLIVFFNKNIFANVFRDGATDTLLKPFSGRHLLHRFFSASLRVSTHYLNPRMNIETPPIFKYLDLEIDFISRTVTIKGKPVDLTPTEFKLISLLTRNGRQIISHEEIIGEIWGPDHQEGDHLLRVTIERLRRKLNPPGKTLYIQSKYGWGYII